VLSAHQGGGEPLRPMLLEITRCLHVPGAELAPPPVRRGPGRVMAVDTPWPNGQPFHNCGRRRLVPASGCRRCRCGHLRGRYPRHVLTPRPGHLCALLGLPRLRSPVEGEGSPLFPSPWQASHCS
jgi:hypothetical protein